MKRIPKAFRLYDTAEHLKSEADIAAYLDACNELEDPDLTIDALSLVARAQSVCACAGCGAAPPGGLQSAGRKNSNPSFASVQPLAKALGLKITLTVATAT